MSKKKYQPCPKCGSNVDEYLYEYADPETLVKEELCFNCVKSKREFDQMKSDYSEGE